MPGKWGVACAPFLCCIAFAAEAGIVLHSFVLRIPDEGIAIDAEPGAKARPVHFTIRKPDRYSAIVKPLHNSV